MEEGKMEEMEDNSNKESSNRKLRNHIHLYGNISFRNSKDTFLPPPVVWVAIGIAIS